MLKMKQTIYCAVLQLIYYNILIVKYKENNGIEQKYKSYMGLPIVLRHNQKSICRRQRFLTNITRVAITTTTSP